MVAPTFEEATAIETVDAHTYTANLRDEWSIGSVPHGGYVTSLFMLVATRHFNTTLAKQKQPHTITLHVEFLRRTQVGPGTFTVRDVKLGRQTSTIQVTLVQDGRDEVTAFLTNSNIHTESGLTAQTNWRMEPAPAPVDLSKLREGTDAQWQLMKQLPFANFRKATQRIKFHFPKAGPPHRSIGDEWITFQSGEKFTNESLGMVSDTWPQLIENYREISPYDIQGKPMDQATNGPPIIPSGATYWFPTLLLNLDVKKALPPGGVEWLFVRVRAKQILNGRLDLEIIILDDVGDIVALSHHVCFVLDASRNLAARNQGSGASKI
ncbi:MAG: Geranylgeranyl transferase type-1 subunit beta [Chaenotheca gracillima]|nr:MAG: Geranylgeranyl transferase type-1 subunit beta [Chaenotheca gracillima]